MKVELRIESLVHGGEGLARSLGRVVFVPGAAPGDLVEAELREADGGRFTRANLLRVLAPGPVRVPAPCPIVDRCGGCPVQHVGSVAQQECKRALVEDALFRIGGFSKDSYELAPLVPSPAAFRYRRRARMHRAASGQWGFAGRASSGVVPVSECLLLEPALQALFDQVRAAAVELGGLPDVADLGLDVADTGAASLDLRTVKPPTAALRKRALALLGKVLQLRGATLGPEGAPELLGEPAIADAPGPAGLSTARFRTRADLFAQANRAATPLLIGAALEALGPAAEGRVLELFCGSGTLTLPLLSRARSVLGVEFAAASLALLRKSAAEAGLDGPGKIRLIAGDSAKVTQGLAASEAGTLDAVLLDPPRTGAASALRALAALRAPRLVYVSCDAPTFARDAKELVKSGYRLSRVVPFDLFPQTAHLELVATFLR